MADERGAKPEDASSPPSPPAPALWLGFDGPGLVLAAVPAVGALVYGFAHDPISRNDSHEGRLHLAVFGLLLLGATALLVGRGFGLAWPRRLFDPAAATSAGKAKVGQLVVGVWLASTIWGGFNYYQFDKKVIGTPGDYADATYYYLNSKYFAELGYYRLYHAMLVVDDEASQRFRRVPRYRDLVGYEAFYTRAHALEHEDEVKAPFTPERWEAFKHDVDWITSQNPKEGWDYFFIDHGYNPPPSWTLVGGTLARLCPVEHIKWITMVDFLLVVFMFGAIAWAFGGPAMLVALLWFLVTFSGRWPILGQSLLRFDWVTALVVAACMLKKGRDGWAGGLITYSALNRVFPVVFGFPYVVGLVRDAWQARKRGESPLVVVKAPKAKGFLVGVGISLALFGLGAVVVVGPQSFADSAVNLKMHGGPDSYSSHRVGLGDALIYRFELDNKQLNANGGMGTKQRMLRDLDRSLKGVGLLAILAIAVYVWRSRKPTWQHLWLGILPVFIMTTPQINYFNMRLLLVLLHMELFDKREHRWPLYGLFAIEAVSQLAMVERAPRYSVTSLTSVGLCVYFAWMIFLLAREVWPGRERPEASGEATAD